MKQNFTEPLRPYRYRYDAVLQIIGAYKLLVPTNKNNKGITTVTRPPTFRNNKMDLPEPSNLPEDAITTIIKCFKHLFAVAMQDVFGKMPYEWPLKIISHHSMMKKLGTSICSCPLLLIRPTNGDKSAVCGIYSIMCTGVPLMIIPLLSLEADQTQKIR
jgi:hypothetical protein